MLLDIIVCALGWALVGWHAWALRYHFDMPVMPPGVRVISAGVVGSASLLTWLTFADDQPVAAQLVGAALIVASGVLFHLTMRESAKAKLLAAFDPDLPHGLLTTGPYAYVRHPFYTSYLTQWVGWAIAAWSPWAVLPVIVMTAIYWTAARDEEAKFSRTPMAADYAQFMRKTGRFLPRINRR